MFSKFYTQFNDTYLWETESEPKKYSKRLFAVTINCFVILTEVHVHTAGQRKLETSAKNIANKMDTTTHVSVKT